MEFTSLTESETIALLSYLQKKGFKYSTINEPKILGRTIFLSLNQEGEEWPLPLAISLDLIKGP